jgi:hypothetical protein
MKDQAPRACWRRALWRTTARPSRLSIFNCKKVIPAGKDLELRLRSSPTREPAAYCDRELSLRVVYKDHLGEFTYETRPKVKAEFDAPDEWGASLSRATFVDSDERSALERRVRRRRH